MRSSAGHGSPMFQTAHRQELDKSFSLAEGRQQPYVRLAQIRVIQCRHHQLATTVNPTTAPPVLSAVD